MPTTTPHRALRRIAVLLLLLLIAAAWTPRAALAQAIVRGDEIPAGEVVDNDVIHIRLSSLNLCNSPNLGSAASATRP